MGADLVFISFVVPLAAVEQYVLSVCAPRLPQLMVMQQINPYSSVQCAVVAPLIAVGIPVTKVAFVFKLNALCRHVLW